MRHFLAWANYKIYLPIGSYSRRGVFHPAYIYPTVVVALIIVVIIAIVMKFTKFGRDVYAVGGNAQSAMMMGLNVRKTKFKAYILNGVLAGCGGFLFCLNSCSGFVEQAKGLEMDAISASVIGGTLFKWVAVGTPFGTIFGDVDQRNYFQFDHNPGYIIQLVGTNRSFRIAMLLHCTAGCVCTF